MVPEVRDMYAGIFKALAHPKRIKIVELLERHGKMCVCEIVAQSQIEQPSVSKHLNILKNAGIIESEKQGLNVKCWLKTPEVSKLLAEVREILKKDLESRQAVFSKKQ
ncbi:ArsR/SmtB family transcription factor [Atrimonas thermophila]|uniref:ArsR/SmtB family transcription factor n=1 Tax=Atrimonas thermophila TaxID=3064161 RepID=UPI00399C79EC